MPIEVKNLSHVYAQGSPFQSAAVQDVSFTLGEGELVGLIGHTGSGKSTLVQHLNGLVKPTSGTVLVDGMDLWAKGTDLRAVRKKVGLVFQYPEYQLFEETVLKDIAFGPRNLGLSEAQAQERAREAAQAVNLPEEVLERSPFDLSGGQKRRVAIAGVLAMHPRTLILDEPAAGLDPSGRREMLALLKALHGRGMTLVMVSHSMTDVSRLCKRVLVMNQGRLVMDGAPGEVFGRAAELKAMGLGLPRGAELALRLREAGFPLPQGLWRMEDVEQAILAALKGGTQA
ncbi:MAG TPA: energy-coupling factor transporter ATPase [Candidatus Excrementavichristensenella intestinipullorum]|nr:energy-coupling factor transporter ATPase [Candidatus Excrementavichristensenella intestinipullorum]